jgi:uncharacterized membrane protein SpoIIM required for sporulation
MILHLERFITAEKPLWDQLEAELRLFERDPFRKLTVDEAARFYFLYQRAASDLARLGELPAHPQTRAHLESLVRRAYAETHETRQAEAFSLRRLLFHSFPLVFRRRIKAFWLACAITLLGVLFGSGAIVFDPDAKPVLMPFEQLMESPAHRVQREEALKKDWIGPVKGSFAAQLITHNINVSFFTLALGTTWGLGTVLILFYNGVTLGAVVADYLRSGYAPFLFGWLLPHGVIEIPAILIAGQAGLLLGGALIGWGDAVPRRQRLRIISSDVLTLAAGLAALLVWAGIVEAFLSQYHQPFLPYAAKIAFGAAELLLLTGWLFGTGRR